MKCTFFINFMLLTAFFIFCISSSLASDALTKNSKEQKKITATGKIQGTLMNHDSNKPVANQQVKLFALKGTPDKEGFADIEDLNISVSTSEKGVFIFDKLPPGKYMLYAGNYNSVRYKDGKTVLAQIMEAQSLDLKTVWVQLR